MWNSQKIPIDGLIGDKYTTSVILYKYKGIDTIIHTDLCKTVGDWIAKTTGWDWKVTRIESYDIEEVIDFNI